MAKDVADVLGNAVGRAAREAVNHMASNRKNGGLPERVGNMVSSRMDGLSGSKGLAAGVGLAAVAPLAAKGAGKLVRGIGGNAGKPAKKVGEKAGDKLGGAAKKAVSKAAGSEGAQGVGKGRRMPIQQDIDIGVPIADVWKHWTNYEEWPTFMHRLQNVSKEDDEHVSFKTKIWGISKEFRAEIEDERENERIKWTVTDGVTHSGVVTFHELGPRLTRVELSLDVEPGSLIEKAARGMRHVKRAVRADLARFKAYVLMEEDGSSASRSSDSGSRTRSSSSRASSSGSRRRSSSSGGRKSSSRSRSSSKEASKRSTSTARKSSKRSTPTARKSSSNGGQKRSPSKTRATSSSNGRSSSPRASSNGRSSSSSRKRTASRS
jgi:uncharacterized membrane protein